MFISFAEEKEIIGEEAREIAKVKPTFVVYGMSFDPLFLKLNLIVFRHDEACLTP